MATLLVLEALLDPLAGLGRLALPTGVRLRRLLTAQLTTPPSGLSLLGTRRLPCRLLLPVLALVVWGLSGLLVGVALLLSRRSLLSLLLARLSRLSGLLAELLVGLRLPVSGLRSSVAAPLATR